MPGTGRTPDVLVAGVAIASFVAFVWAFHVSGLITSARAAVTTARDAASTLNDPDLADDERERRARTASLSLLSYFVGIALRSALVLLAPALVLLVADVAGLAASDTVTAFLLTWPALTGFSAAAILVFAVSRRT
jgi:hypothetical protein